jgi:hypothetical protein
MRVRVSVLLPTTGSLIRVLGLEARPDLPAAAVYLPGTFMPLPITKEYDVLTSKAGPLTALAPLVQPGPHWLWLTRNIESGQSWHMPVVLAHIVTALGAELVPEPHGADVVLWSTGEVDAKLAIVDRDYRLPEKVLHSRDGLQDAVKTGARIVGLVPGTDAAPLRDLLNEIEARDPVVETVASVDAACLVVKRVLGRTLPVVKEEGPLPVDEAPVTISYEPPQRSLAPLAGFQAAGTPVLTVPRLGNDPRLRADDSDDTVPARNWKRRAVAASLVTSLALAASVGGSDVILRLIRPDTTNTSGSPLTDSPKEHAQSAQPKPPDAAPGEKPAVVSPETDKPPVSQKLAENAVPPQTSPPPPVLPPVPVKLQEFRAANDGTCIPYIIERRTPPRTIDVALDSSSRFHDSAGRNLCMLEWTVNPEAAGVQGFDMDPPRVPGVRLSGTGAAGTWTKVRIEFTRDFTNIPATYTVRLKYNGAPSPDQVQQFQHTIK